MCEGCGKQFLFDNTIVCKRCKRIDNQFCLQCHNKNDFDSPRAKYLPYCCLFVWCISMIYGGLLV